MSKPILILLIFTLFSCQRTQKSDGIKTQNEHSDTKSTDKDFTILNYNTEWWWIFENATAAELDSDELKKVDELIETAIQKNNEQRQHFVDVVNSHLERKAIEKTGFELDSKEYKRQYVAVLNESGEKEVWINFFCKKDFEYVDWKKELIIVEDGGNCYFNLKVNITKGEYYDLQINGVA